MPGDVTVQGRVQEEVSTRKPTGQGGGNAADPACVVCRGSAARVVFREFGIDVLRCKSCGHVYSSHVNPQDYDGYFGERIEGGEQFWWDTAHRRMYRDFGRRFLAGRSGRLLDVGCGLGYFVRFASHYPGWKVRGHDTSRAAVDHARDKLGLASVRWGRVQESGFAGKHFDIITLWDVIEHIPDPDPLLWYLASILKDDGFLFLHTPNIRVQLPKARLRKLVRGMKEGLHYLEARDHMNIYSEETLGRVLRRAGFEDIRLTHLHPVQSVSGSTSAVLRVLKNLWFEGARGLHHLTLGRVNLDNLFVIARKGKA